MARLWLVFWGLGAWAQGPEIDRNGVVNAAANAPLALADSAIARGAVLIVRGSRLGAHLPDVSAKLKGAAGEARLAIVPGDPSAVTARVPANAPLGPASLTVVVNGRSSPPYPVKVVPAQFGIYATNGKGWGPGLIRNVADAKRSLNTVFNAASLGQTLALSGTGLGDAKTPVVFVGGRPARVIGARASPDGDEILFQVPADAPQGCFVPVQVRNAGGMASNTVTVAIHKSGGACGEPEYFPFAGWAGARFGMVAITRTVQREYGVEPVSDEATAWFGQLPGLEKLNPYFLLPPPGTCTSEVEPWRGGFVPATLISLLASRAGAKALQAGDELTIDDGRTLRRVPAFHGMKGVFDRELSDLMGRP
ncbi:MAG TPA: IPT/TIG domain-containing protein, partial [Bryobacteraceae bacterium]|nr:IPT/TIG domain-containing protein [Bryobacteraceae bacterium]